MHSGLDGSESVDPQQDVGVGGIGNGWQDVKTSVVNLDKIISNRVSH